MALDLIKQNPFLDGTLILANLFMAILVLVLFLFTGSPTLQTRTIIMNSIRVEIVLVLNAKLLS